MKFLKVIKLIDQDNALNLPVFLMFAILVHAFVFVSFVSAITFTVAAGLYFYNEFNMQKKSEMKNNEVLAIKNNVDQLLSDMADLKDKTGKITLSLGFQKKG